MQVGTRMRRICAVVTAHSYHRCRQDQFMQVGTRIRWMCAVVTAHSHFRCRQDQCTAAHGEYVAFFDMPARSVQKNKTNQQKIGSSRPWVLHLTTSPNILQTWLLSKTICRDVHRYIQVEVKWKSLQLRIYIEDGFSRLTASGAVFSAPSANAMEASTSPAKIPFMLSLRANTMLDSKQKSQQSAEQHFVFVSIMTWSQSADKYQDSKQISIITIGRLTPHQSALKTCFSLTLNVFLWWGMMLTLLHSLKKVANENKSNVNCHRFKIIRHRKTTFLPIMGLYE